MRFVLSLAVACLAFGFAAPPRADAQYPVYVPQSYVPQSYGQVVHGHSHSHHCPASTSQYYSGYGAPVYQYPSVPTYVSGYSAGAIYAQPVAQPVAPPTSNYYFNNTYYDAHSHHAWHPGHYLLGHH